MDDAPGRATLATLGVHMCKWPIGEPLKDGFTYCCRRSDAGPYCDGHTQIAYRPGKLKPRRRDPDIRRALTH